MKVRHSTLPAGPGLVGWMPDEVFEVDGITYIAPHIAHRMRCEEHPDAPEVGTGYVYRKPMIKIYRDHLCWPPDTECCPEASGRAWSWESDASTPTRPSP